MNILAVDCCLRLTGAAVMRNGIIVGYVQEDYGRRQTSELPGICAGLMESAGLSWQKLDYVALTTGPGYFTGIRVGAAYASGIAYACGAKILPVSTLELLPYTFRKSHDAGKILTVIYAGHGYVYASCEDSLMAGGGSRAGGLGAGEDSYSGIRGTGESLCAGSLEAGNGSRDGVHDAVGGSLAVGHDTGKNSCSGVLIAGEYSHAQILDWLGKNPDAVTISDDPERTGLDAEMFTVKPDVLSLCEIAGGRLDSAIDPAGLKINYYRAPQGVS
ncbi:MAG: tRNA (adenosine(37)-N6)-threonylcarbamoyltransferase complex dimerization subunit type 1 TsaB [Synergistaceae bacterium]|nr:tRNA (adenosine(37)-N6)-threonylcarbamoyltransferase complex dimerization subunit type 1 TsaB [Synergistaceae bacterium]